MICKGEPVAVAGVGEFVCGATACGGSELETVESVFSGATPAVVSSEDALADPHCTLESGAHIIAWR